MHPDLIETVQHLKTTKLQILIQIILVFIAPVLLLQYSITPISFRTLVLVGVVSLLVYILYKEQWTPKMLGYISRASKREALAYTIFTIVGVIAIAQFGELIGNEEVTRWWTHPHFLYLFIIVSVFQEVAYRGFLIPALGKLSRSPFFIVILNASLFAFLHIIFPNLSIGLPLAFIGGIGFALMYMRYPNLPMIMVSHAVLNFCAVLYGFFTIAT